MDTDYRTYSFDELARDAYFRKWVIERDASSAKFWANWLSENTDCANNVQLAKAFLLALEEKDTSLSVPELEQITDTIVQPDERPIVPLWRSSAFRVAASVLLIAGIGYGFLFLQRTTADKPSAVIQAISPSLAQNYLETTNETTRNRRIVLEDRSVVVLYPNSKLRYPGHFGTSIREVYLSGRAFFAITKNPSKPFWVYTNKISTQVLGTSFLVSAYADTDEAKVEVTSGKVSVYTLKDVDRARQVQDRQLVGVVLTPNQKVAYTQTEERLIKSVVAQPARLEQVQSNTFIFDEAPIAGVFALLEKTYGLTVIYDAQTMKNCFLTADLTNETLFDQLNLICKVTRSSYELVDGQIIIYSRGCTEK